MTKNSQIPNNVKQVLFRTILDYKSGYEFNPTEAQHKIDFFESVLDVGEINAFFVSQLFSHFFELQEYGLAKLQKPNINQKIVKSLIKDSQIVLDYLHQNFEIKGNSKEHLISERKVS